MKPNLLVASWSKSHERRAWEGGKNKYKNNGKDPRKGNWPRDFSEKDLLIQGSRMKKKQPPNQLGCHASHANGIWHMAGWGGGGREVGFYPAITSKLLSTPCGQLSQEGFPDATIHGQRDSSPFPQASGYPGSSRVRMQVVSPPWVSRHRLCGLSLFGFLIPETNR